MRQRALRRIQSVPSIARRRQTLRPRKPSRAEIRVEIHGTLEIRMSPSLNGVRIRRGKRDRARLDLPRDRGQRFQWPAIRCLFPRDLVPSGVFHHDPEP